MTETIKLFIADYNDGYIDVEISDIFPYGIVDTGVTTDREVVEYLITYSLELWDKAYRPTALRDWITEKEPALDEFFEDELYSLSAEVIDTIKESVRRETATEEGLQEMLVALQKHSSEPVLFLKRGETNPYLLEFFKKMIKIVTGSRLKPKSYHSIYDEMFPESDNFSEVISYLKDAIDVE